MPIYDYKCVACGHELEALQKLSDPQLVECPECGQSALKKQVSAPSFRLSGSGWYETDFKTGKQKNLAGDGNDGGAKQPVDSAKGDAAGTDSSSEKKPAAKESKAPAEKPGKAPAA